jgi:hypothetical protein
MKATHFPQGLHKTGSRELARQKPANRQPIPRIGARVPAPALPLQTRSALPHAFQGLRRAMFANLAVKPITIRGIA